MPISRQPGVPYLGGPVGWVNAEPAARHVKPAAGAVVVLEALLDGGVIAEILRYCYQIGPGIVVTVRDYCDVLDGHVPGPIDPQHRGLARDKGARRVRIGNDKCIGIVSRPLLACRRASGAVTEHRSEERRV